MALKTSTGYVRFAISTGMDEKTLTVNWLTFHNDNWRENNPRRVWQGIVENGSHTFDLAIKEKHINSEGQEEEIILGYLPQSMDQAHELLRNLSGKDCNFKSINFQIV
ncbi:hypothetical protein [Rhodonellum sp.]|uniref:hypothetical protein n=1 Tax=Rhodonellum sp. TaxID=2231180 RepID=UPI002724B963|nr:hypothetical protein [Rhodonellum sp.]MDO9554522.1 hypothetical protein [Rhodonellum sp.]